jgi:hypothetical protein
MHVHANQFNALLEMNAMYAGARAEARMEAERTRKSLSRSASALLGAYDEDADYVVWLSGDREPKGHSHPQGEPDQEEDEEPDMQASSDDTVVSRWA